MILSFNTYIRKLIMMLMANFFLIVLQVYQIAVSSAQFIRQTPGPVPPELIVYLSGTIGNKFGERIDNKTICDLMANNVNTIITWSNSTMGCLVEITQANIFNGSMSFYGYALKSSYNNPYDFPLTFKQMVQGNSSSKPTITVDSSEVTKAPESTLTLTLSDASSGKHTDPEKICVEVLGKLNSTSKTLGANIFGCLLSKSITSKFHSLVSIDVFFNLTGLKRAQYYVDIDEFKSNISQILNGLFNHVDLVEIGDEIQVNETGSVYYAGEPAPYNESLKSTLSSYYRALYQCLIFENYAHFGDFPGLTGMRMYSLYNDNGDVKFILTLFVSVELFSKQGFGNTTQQIIDSLRRKWNDTIYQSESCARDVRFEESQTESQIELSTESPTELPNGLQSTITPVIPPIPPFPQFTTAAASYIMTRHVFSMVCTTMLVQVVCFLIRS